MNIIVDIVDKFFVNKLAEVEGFNVLELIVAYPLGLPHFVRNDGEGKSGIATPTFCRRGYFDSLTVFAMRLFRALAKTYFITLPCLVLITVLTSNSSPVWAST